MAVFHTDSRSLDVLVKLNVHVPGDKRRQVSISSLAVTICRRGGQVVPTSSKQSRAFPLCAPQRSWPVDNRCSMRMPDICGYIRACLRARLMWKCSTACATGLLRCHRPKGYSMGLSVSLCLACQCQFTVPDSVPSIDRCQRESWFLPREPFHAGAI